MARQSAPEIFLVFAPQSWDYKCSFLDWLFHVDSGGRSSGPQRFPAEPSSPSHPPLFNFIFNRDETHPYGARGSVSALNCEVGLTSTVVSGHRVWGKEQLVSGSRLHGQEVKRGL